MDQASSTKPTPYSQFGFFKSLSYSLFEYDWINMVESWQAMVAVNAPIPEFSYNITPFFANAPRLLPAFNRYMALAEQVGRFSPFPPFRSRACMSPITAGNGPSMDTLWRLFAIRSFFYCFPQHQRKNEQIPPPSFCRERVTIPSCTGERR